MTSLGGGEEYGWREGLEAKTNINTRSFGALHIYVEKKNRKKHKK